MTGFARPFGVAAGLVAVVVLMWILAVPLSAGPDEPDHLVRSAALVRGDLDGVGGNRNYTDCFELPAWIGHPPPNCYRFMPDEPVTCASDLERPTGEAVLGTRADDYQVWGHLLAGLGSFAPAGATTIASRLLDAVLPVAAVAAVLVAAVRRGWSSVGAAVLAITPMAWFTFAVVNPSGLVIAGGLAFWVGLVSTDRHPDTLHRWLMGAGWAAMSLPRRDGLIWASLSLGIGILATNRGLLEWWRGLGRGPQVAVVVSTTATLAWASQSDASSVRFLFLTPFVPVAAALARRAWGAPWLASPGRRVAAVAATVVVGGLGALVIMDQRASGFDRGALRFAIIRTGEDVMEAVGHLGWLDTPLPTTLLYLWMVTLGALVGAALIAGDRGALVGAAVVVGVAVVVSWVLTMLQDQPLSTYWQGRYYLPLLVGVPVLLGRAALGPDEQRRLGRYVLLVGLVAVNVALAAAVRRWAVGIAGTLLPWEWDTYDTVVPPVVLLAVHLAATVGLWVWVHRAVATRGV